MKPLKIPFIGPSTNALRHYRVYHNAKKLAQVAVRNALKKAYPKGYKPIEGAVDLILTPYMGKSKRSYDVTNYSTTLKIVEDILVEQKLLKGDTPNYVKSIKIVAPVKYAAWKGKYKKGTDSFIILKIKTKKVKNK